MLFFEQIVDVENAVLVNAHWNNFDVILVSLDVLECL